MSDKILKLSQAQTLYQDLRGRIDALPLDEKADTIINSASGTIASFSDGADNMPLEKCIIEIEPVQDLHGYDNPWPAGGGANVFDGEWEQGDIQAGSEAASNTTIRSKNFIEVLPSSTYYGYNDGKTVFAFEYDANKAYLSKVTNIASGDHTFTTESTTKYIRLANRSAATLSDSGNIAINYPATVTTYASYANICPITGWTGCNVSRTGKNLLNAVSNNTITYSTYTHYTVDDTTGTVTITNGTLFGFIVNVKPSTQYTFSAYKDIYIDLTMRIREYTSSPTTWDDDSYITQSVNESKSASGTISVTFTTTATTEYILAVFYRGNYETNIQISNIQLELGSAATAYEPYTGTTLPISWQSEAGTVYGGTLDVVSGVLTVDRASVDLGTLGWNATANGYAQSQSYPNAKQPASASTIANIICSEYTPDTQSNVYNRTTDNTIAISIGTTTIRLYDSSLKDKTNAEYQAALSGVQLVYELATPVTYQLTPQELTTLLGTNNVWADCGQVSLRYPADTKTYVDESIPNVPVQDVRVNGVSVVNQGVANVPVANNTLGLVRVVSTGQDGVRIRTEDGTRDKLVIVGATGTEIKNSNNFKPVLPSHQHESTFYGLAKAAGADMANLSNVTVGTYPDAQKAAIQKMLGISDLLATEENNLSASKPYSIGDIFTANGKLYKATEAIAQDAGIFVEGTGVNCQEVKADEVFVKNTDYATSYTGGIIRIGSGLQMAADGKRLYTRPAASTKVKAGADSYDPIVPNTQHESVFYGLSKAAGVDLASETVTVGTYSATASAAIRSMLGITQTLTVTVLTQDNVTVTNQTVTLREGGPTGQIYATATYSGQPVSFALPTGFSYYVSVSDTLAHHFNPTTASGIITDADAAATLTYSDFSSIQTAADIKAALNAGLDLTDLVGEQISCQWNGSTLVWDVVDYSNDTITLLTHDTLPTQLVFEPVQALMWCENGLAAGSYSFIDGTTTYYFTLTTAIPSGGQLRATTSAFQTYASMEATATLETGTVSTTEISGATSLGTTASGNLNHMSRVNYGSNNYKESGLFQWLNSTEAANTPMPRITKFSRPCTYSVPGFLGALDSSFVAAIDDTTWLCSTNNTYECPTSLGGTVAKSNAYTVTAKVGLASEMEIFGSYGGTADGSAIFDLFNGATADDRKKYQPGTSTARNWWLRSPHWGNATIERYVVSSGTAHNNIAYYSFGVVPAVKISKTVVSE